MPTGMAHMPNLIVLSNRYSTHRYRLILYITTDQAIDPYLLLYILKKYNYYNKPYLNVYTKF